MNKAYFEIIRPGIHSTLQDLGRSNQYHIGIPFSGSMDKRNYLIGNKLVGNKANEASMFLLSVVNVMVVKSVPGLIDKDVPRKSKASASSSAE